MKISEYAKKAGILFVSLILVIMLVCYITSEGNESETAFIPVKSEKMLVVGGHSVGVRMDVKGVLVVGLENIVTEEGETVNPGIEAGLEIGDTIIEINGENILNVDTYRSVTSKLSADDSVEIKYIRNGKEEKAEFKIF